MMSIISLDELEKKVTLLDNMTFNVVKLTCLRVKVYF
jgi:hypothetical protein